MRVQSESTFFQNATALLVRKALNGSHDGKKIAEARNRLSALATRQADRTGISFAGSTFQSEYYKTKFARRGRLLHAILNDVITSYKPSSNTRLLLEYLYSKYNPDKLNSLDSVLTKYRGRHSKLLTAVAKKYNAENDLKAKLFRDSKCFLDKTFRSNPSCQVVQVASFGGGPGTDAAGFMFFLQKENPELRFHINLLDYEKSWKRYVKTLNTIFSPRVVVQFTPCDVTARIPTEEEEDCWTNAKIKNIEKLDIIVFSYVINETSEKAEKEGFVFYVDLAKKVREGCIVIIADVLNHSRFEIEKVIKVMSSVREVKRVQLSTSHKATVAAFIFGKVKKVAINK
eukprot:g4718.t1